MTLSLLEWEQKAVRYGSALLCLALLSGFATWIFVPDSEVGVTTEQWVFLLHVFVGFLLIPILLPYLWVHFKRTLGVRRPLLLFTGLLLSAIVLILSASGVHIAVFGQQEAQSWIFTRHVQTAIAFVLLTLMHVVYHRVSHPKKKSSGIALSGTFFPSTQGLTFRSVVIPMVTAILLLAGVVLYYLQTWNPDYQTGPRVEPYEYRYGEHPFRPSQTETWHGKFVDHRQIAGSDDCGACHQDIFQQWRSSAHRQAASDKTYVTNISLLAEKKGISATRYCEGCHAPIALLSGQLSPGGDHGGIENTTAHIEGVSCLSCHGIERPVHLKGVASYEYKPPKDYLFPGTQQAQLNELRHMLIRMHPGQHKRDMSRPVLKQAELCATCHVQFMDKDMNGWGWVKMQDEYTAWLESPYSRQSHQTFASGDITRCQDCHMPMVPGKDPSQNADGMVRAHYFPGANTMLPVIAGDLEQFERTRQFLQADRLRITIEEPKRKDATQTLATIQESLRASGETPYYYYLGETAKVRVIISNSGVGHNFPGGTTDINEAWVAFTVTDAEGQVVYQSGNLRDDNTLDPKAHTYRSWPIDRKGELVWKHDLFNRIGEAFENVIPAGQSDFVEYSFAVPSWTKGPLTVSAAVRYRKLNEPYARWAMKEKYTPLPIVDMARTSLTIPVKTKPKTVTRK